MDCNPILETLLFSVRTVLLASSQSCRSVDPDAQCTRTLNSVVVWLIVNGESYGISLIYNERPLLVFVTFIHIKVWCKGHTTIMEFWDSCDHRRLWAAVCHLKV